MNKVIGWTLAIVSVIGLVLGVYYLLWKGWIYIMPKLYPTGSEYIINPSYWFFVLCLFVFCAIGKSIFGGSK